MSPTDALIEENFADSTDAAESASPTQEPSPTMDAGPERKSDFVAKSNSQVSGKKRLPTFAMVGVVALVIGLLGFAIQATRNDKDAVESESSQALPVTVIRVGTVSAPELSRSYSGVLLARQTSLLSFERGGRVLTLAKQEGDAVRTGERIAELDQENLDAMELRTQSELSAAEARLEELIAGPRQQTIDAAKARVEQLAAEVALAQVDAERQQRLKRTNATSDAAYDAALFGLQASQNALAAQRATLDELLEGTRKEQIAIQQANVAGMRASLKEIQAQRRDSRIEAPFNGVIQSRIVDEGVVVNVGAAAYELVSHEIEARFGLPPDVAARMKRGDAATLTLRRDSRQGWVDRVEPTVDRSTRTRGVFVRFHSLPTDDPAIFRQLTESGWVAGELPELLINESEEGATDDGKFWLPVKSLRRASRGLWTVLVVPGEEPTATCERRAVELLKTDGERALVQGMIQRNERVVAEGVHRITTGLLVAPTATETRDERG